MLLIAIQFSTLERDRISSFSSIYTTSEARSRPPLAQRHFDRVHHATSKSNVAVCEHNSCQIGLGHRQRILQNLCGLVPECTPPILKVATAPEPNATSPLRIATTSANATLNVPEAVDVIETSSIAAPLMAGSIPNIISAVCHAAKSTLITRM